MEALQEAIRTAGGLRALARHLGTSHQAIRQWDKAPPARVLEIERLTGIPRQALRPDLYPERAADVGRPLMLELKTLRDPLRIVTQRAVSRAVYSLLARDPDVLDRRKAAALERRLANLLYEELRRAQMPEQMDPS